MGPSKGPYHGTPTTLRQTVPATSSQGTRETRETSESTSENPPVDPQSESQIKTTPAIPVQSVSPNESPSTSPSVGKQSGSQIKPTPGTPLKVQSVSSNESPSASPSVGKQSGSQIKPTPAIPLKVQSGDPDDSTSTSPDKSSGLEDEPSEYECSLDKERCEYLEGGVWRKPDDKSWFKIQNRMDIFKVENFKLKVRVEVQVWYTTRLFLLFLLNYAWT